MIGGYHNLDNLKSQAHLGILHVMCECGILLKLNCRYQTITNTKSLFGKVNKSLKFLNFALNRVILKKSSKNRGEIKST